MNGTHTPSASFTTGTNAQPSIQAPDAARDDPAPEHPPASPTHTPDSPRTFDAARAELAADLVAMQRRIEGLVLLLPDLSADGREMELNAERGGDGVGSGRNGDGGADGVVRPRTTREQEARIRELDEELRALDGEVDSASRERDRWVKRVEDVIMVMGRGRRL